jgi:hypothetical protein
VGTTAHDQQQTPTLRHQANSPGALIEFVRLLARQAACEAFVTTQPAVASEPDLIEPEDSHEAQV